MQPHDEQERAQAQAIVATIGYWRRLWVEHQREAQERLEQAGDGIVELESPGQALSRLHVRLRLSEILREVEGEAVDLIAAGLADRRMRRAQKWVEELREGLEGLQSDVEG